MDSKVCEISGLSVELGRVEILHDIDLVLHRGELIWLSGFNGAGKSTLLRTLAGLLPYNGEILICGHEPWEIEARSSFVYVPDKAALYEDLTLEEHVHFTSMVYEQEEAVGRTLRWLDRFNLTDRLGEFPVTHSRGMQQKLSLALALGLDLPFLMLDEPYDGLDEKAQPLLSEALQERASGGGTILFTTHQAHHAVPIGSRELVLEEGRLLPPPERGPG